MEYKTGDVEKIAEITAKIGELAGANKRLIQENEHLKSIIDRLLEKSIEV